MAQAPMLDMTMFTPEMLQAAGINPARMQSQLGDISTVPVTQEQRDKLGRVRNKRLRLMKITGVIMFIVSLVAIIVGIIAVAVSHEFPYKMGGAALAGVAGIISCLMSWCMIREGKKTPTGSETTSCMVTLVKVYMLSGFFLSQMLMMGLGMSGIWGTVTCLERKPSDDYDEWSFNNCYPDTSALLALSVLTLILSASLLALFVISCCAFCCNSRAFGIKSGYERLMDLQMLRVAEMQRLQQQQQAGANMYGGQPAGQQNPNMYGGQPVGQQYYQGQGYQYQQVPQGAMGPPPPSAPPVSGAEDPPSYYDVMKK